MDEQRKDFIRQLEFEYHSIKAANPHFDKSLWDFLKSRGCTDDEIWEYSPSIGYEANQPEPDWF